MEAFKSVSLPVSTSKYNASCLKTNIHWTNLQTASTFKSKLQHLIYHPILHPQTDRDQSVMIDAATFVTTTLKLGGGVLPTFFRTIKDVSTQQWSNPGKPVLDIHLHRTLFRRFDTADSYPLLYWYSHSPVTLSRYIWWTRTAMRTLS